MLGQIKEVVAQTIQSYQNRKKTLLASNGIAADAQHIAGGFVSQFYFNREGIVSIALTMDTSVLMVMRNDYGYDKLFTRQVQAQGVKGDVFSTSGCVNLIEALKVCRDKGLISVGFTGESGGKMLDLYDDCIKVSSACTSKIQESHIVIGHILCAIVEEEMFGKGFLCRR